VSSSNNSIGTKTFTPINYLVSWQCDLSKAIYQKNPYSAPGYFTINDSKGNLIVNIAAPASTSGTFIAQPGMIYTVSVYGGVMQGGVGKATGSVSYSNIPNNPPMVIYSVQSGYGQTFTPINSQVNWECYLANALFANGGVPGYFTIKNAQGNLIVNITTATITSGTFTAQIGMTYTVSVYGGVAPGGIYGTAAGVVSYSTVDNILPIVSISSPASGIKVHGSVPVSVSASDNVGVAKVDLYIDGKYISTTSTAPYTFNVDTTTLTYGTHTLAVEAFDPAGNQTMSSGIYIIVDNPPKVSITNPSNTNINGIINILINATDDNQVSYVDLYIENVKQTRITSPPYSYIWDTRTFLDGSHTISATACDSAGQTQSASNNIIIDNTGPTINITGPLNPKIYGLINIMANALDNSGVALVEFYIDNIKQVTFNNPPFSYNWDTSGCSVNSIHNITVKAYDQQGNMQQATMNVIVTNKAQLDIYDITPLPLINAN
jgi:hypothetical protein